MTAAADRHATCPSVRTSTAPSGAIPCSYAQVPCSSRRSTPARPYRQPAAGPGSTLRTCTARVGSPAARLIPLGYGSPLGYGHDHDDDRDDDHADGDEHGRRSGKAAGRRDVLITAFDKGPEAPGIRTRIFKLRHADDFSCSGRW